MTQPPFEPDARPTAPQLGSTASDPTGKRHRRWPWIVGGAAVILIGLTVLGSLLPNTPSKNTAAAAAPVSTDSATTLDMPTATSATAKSAIRPAPKRTSPTRTAAARTTTYDGAARLLASAGPLHAHLGGPDGNSVLCDTDTATAANADGAVQVTLNFPGPANVQADLLDATGQGQNLQYTESSQDGGHVFTFPGYTLAQLQALDVDVSSAAGGGTCYLLDNM